MLLWFLLVSVVQRCMSGGVPVQLQPSVEAHGPLARLALDAMSASGNLQYYRASTPLAASGINGVLSAASLPVPPLTPTFRTVPLAQRPVPIAPFPVATNAQAAPVDIVHHVPSTADVPITNYSTQPGYVQRLVDVAKAKIATAKLQVRRPAIQKQFYDIEERTVVRPIGSAVLELEEPISKNVIKPFTVVPANHKHTVAQYQLPAYPGASYPFVSYAPFQVPVQAHYPSFIQQTPIISQYPQPPQQLVPVHQYPQQITNFPTAPQQPTIPVVQSPQQFPQSPNAPTDDSFSSSEFDSSDTVVIDNPDFGRSVSKEREGTDEARDSLGKSGKEPQEPLENGINEQNPGKEDTFKSQQILDEFQSRQLLRQILRKNNVQPVPTMQQSQAVQLFNFQIPQDREQTQSLQRSKDVSSIIQPAVSMEYTGQEETSNTAESDLSTLFSPSANLPQTIQRAQFKNFPSEGQIASVRNLSPEEYQNNQQKLIALLTGQDEILEIDLSKSGKKISAVGDAGVVRGRVISVTSAPSTSEQEEEKVSTRRIVVSRPIQTLEEVDIQQPFTKLERVAVQEPVLLKTVHSHIARIPAAVPVISRTFAPLIYH